MPIDPERIRKNLASVRARIESACAKSRRTNASVILVAVTKTVDLSEVRVLNSLGINNFGENRVHELARKAAALSSLGATWHMIGHLQRNKAKDLLPHSRILHSLESPALAEVLSRRAAGMALEVEVLIEVNTSGEEAKDGLAPGAAEVLAERIASLPGLRLRGLMTMAPITDDPEKVRPLFAALRELAGTLGRNLPPGSMSELSMGMSQDFEVAIEEGATMVRIGSALFV